MNSSIKAKNLKQQLHEIKAICAKTPSVSGKFSRCNRIIKAKEKEIL